MEQKHSPPSARDAAGKQEKCCQESSYSRMANVLGDMISYRPPPLTVGVFGKWGTGKSRMLNLVRDRIECVTSTGPQKPNVFSISLFSLIFRMLFFHPNLKVRKSKDVKFIFVDFSILDYAGTDQLWAGVITHISSTIEEMFGSWSVRAFRAWHYKPDKDLQRYLEVCEQDPKGRETSRWNLSMFAVFVGSALLSIVMLVIVLWSIYGFPQLPAAEGDVLTTVITTSIAAMLGLGVASKIGDIISMVMNLIKTQAEKVKSMANETNFSSNLGFMYKVKTEIHYMTSLVRYAGHLLEKEFRLCLIVDDIDILTSDKVMGLFRVASLLECSPNSPYVQILCMDPYIAASVVKKSLNSELKNGHAYLRKHIELPFHIPNLDQKNKLRFLLSKKAVKELAGIESPQLSIKKKGDKRDEEIPLVKVVNDLKQGHKATEKGAAICQAGDYRRSWNDVRECFTGSPNLLDFIDGNELRVQRILSSTQLALRLMASVPQQQNGPPDIEKLASWIILVDQWPYRLSCIWQAIEDNMQLYDLDPSITYRFSSESKLSDLYPLVITDLKAASAWKEFLELDADPEMFAQFLDRFPLTVGDLNAFLPYTTNLDRSLRRIVANAIVKNRISGKTRLQNHINRWRYKKPLDKWTVDDVCTEFGEIGLNAKNLINYLETIKNHDIDGKTLRRVAPADIKKQLKMSLGDWVAAKEHFAALRTFYGQRLASAGLNASLNGVVGVSRNELLSTSIEEYCSDQMSEDDV